MRLTLIGRTYCHLCDDLRAALLAESARLRIEINLQEVDLDALPAWEERYGERVPVLIAGDSLDGPEICHYFFDADRFYRAVAERDAVPSPVPGKGAAFG